MANQSPRLFGINYSNRDFSLPDTWGKNQFNSSLPASLAAYISKLGLENIYLKLDNKCNVKHDKISTSTLFGINPTDENLFFGFENPYTPYQQLLIGNLPRVDLVTQRKDNGTCIKGLEIKLTALPDNSTCNLTEDKFGSEIVIRPDTIVYLACSIVMNYRKSPKSLLNIMGADFEGIKDWTEAESVLPYVKKMLEVLDNIALKLLDVQEPLVMQPIWKTVGKSPKLAENCLDVFVWSNLAFTQLFCDVARVEIAEKKITRQIRTIVWLFKMLYDFGHTGQINHERIIDELSYNTKNDKAFAVSGRVTQPYMACAELTKPRITKDQIKEIIFGRRSKFIESRT